jgi:hypothetical protein
MILKSDRVSRSRGDTMRFKQSDDNYYEIKPIRYEQSILINYKLVELSSRKLISIDRGSNTDRYASTITFRGTKVYIRGLIEELTLLRRSKKQVLIDEFDVRVFGENIDHTGTISCVVSNLGKETSPTMNVQEVVVEFLSTDTTTIGGTGIPTSIMCLNSAWSGYSTWNTNVVETYNRDNYFVDNSVDRYEFSGTYTMSLSDTQEILNYWKTQRGVSFTITDGDWGTGYMFGIDAGNGIHDVIIQNITYTRISPIMRSVNIKMIKVG